MLLVTMNVPLPSLRERAAALLRRVARRAWTPTVRRVGLGLVVLAVLVAALWLLPERLLRWDLGDDADDWLGRQPTLLDAYRQTVLKVLGGGIVGVGLYFTYRRLQQTDTTNRISEEGQVTERFTRAIEQLGSEHTAIQLGGIYALERIARDSPKDHATVMEVLSAFIRENATEEANTFYGEDYPGGDRGAVGSRVQTVLQAAVTALGRREVRLGEPTINLRGVWLRGYDLRGVRFPRVNLSRAHLEGSYLSKADLKGARLIMSHLEGSHLDDANLEKAALFEAYLRNSLLRNTILECTYLRSSHLEGASLSSKGISTAICEVSDFYGARIDRIRYAEGMPDPRTEAWSEFVAERRATRPSGGTV